MRKPKAAGTGIRSFLIGALSTFIVAYVCLRYVLQPESPADPTDIDLIDHYRQMHALRAFGFAFFSAIMGGVLNAIRYAVKNSD